MLPIDRIETKRLRLRPWEAADAPRAEAAIRNSLPELRSTLNWARLEPIALEARAQLLQGFRAKFDAGEDFAYGIFAGDGMTVIGGAGMHFRVGPEAAEIGYWIATEYAGQGYATEAAAALVRVGFDAMSLCRIEIHCDPANQASARIAEKLGFRHEATLARRLPPLDGGWRDRMIWSLFVEDYPSALASSLPVLMWDRKGNGVHRGSRG